MRGSRQSLTGCVVSGIVVCLGVLLAQAPAPPNDQLRVIQIPKVGENFRYSLCENRFLQAGEVSKPCYPSNTTSVQGAHNAPIVFSTRSNTFLPKGWGIDGNGILFGRVDKNFAGLRVELCAKQLNAESCNPVFISRPGLAPPEPAKQAAAPPKEGSSMAKGLGWAAVGGGGAVAAGLIAAKISNGPKKDCGEAPAFSWPAPTSSQIAAYKSWCQCEGYRTAGTASNGDYGCLK